jgi:hypothetical protein
MTFRGTGLATAVAVRAELAGWYLTGLGLLPVSG